MLLVVTGLKFGVEYSADYDDEDQPIPFRRRVFPSCLDGKHITGKNVEDLIKNKSFKKLDDDDAVSLCCIGILQLVLLGRVLVERLIQDEVEAGSGWWLSSRAYFNGCVTEAERRPRHLNRQNHYEVPSELYRDFQEQRSGLDQLMKQGKNIFEKMKKYMEDLNVGTGANREPIIVDQHYGISDLSEFQSIQGGPSSFQTPTNHSFFNMGTTINWQTPRPSQRSSSNWQSQMPAYTPSPNWQPPIPSHPGDAGLCDLNKLERPRREQRPSVYMRSPYTPLPLTTELPKKRVGKTKKKCKNDNLSPLNLGNAFAYDNAGGDDVVITGVHDTGIYFTYENVDPNKVTQEEYNDFKQFILNQYEVYLDCYMMGYLVSNFFWRQLVPHLCMPRSHSVDNPYQEGWLSEDQMNAWIEILIRSRPQNADWTVSKSRTACVHIENNQFMIETDPHIIGTLDGSTRPYPP
nr:hypothetical protein [Tanacetum cinerariifolium]